MGGASSKPISVAVFGLGKIALEQHIPTINASNDFRLAATISQNKAIPGVPSFATLKELTDSIVEVDAIALCMPPGPRHDIALEAIDAGYDLLLEKPPCVTTDDCGNLYKAARRRDVTIFASWHSKFAPMVQSAKRWIDINGCNHFSVIWRENVLKWHPGQSWVTEANGFGVLDPGVNAFSILTALFDSEFAFEEVVFYRPSNWKTPIAASFQMQTTTGALGKVDFDWRSPDIDVWEIHFFSGVNKMVLSHGGQKLFVNDTPADLDFKQPSEYSALYEHFSDLVRSGNSDFDYTPLQFVEALHEKANWIELQAFRLD